MFWESDCLPTRTGRSEMSFVDLKDPVTAKARKKLVSLFASAKFGFFRRS